MAKLKRALTFFDAMAIDIGAIIGAGIFVISGLAANSAGPAAIVSILIGAVIAILTGLSYAEIAHLYSKEGGIYEYSREILGDYAAVVSGLLGVVSSVIAVAAVSISFGGYFLSIFGIKNGVQIVASVLVVLLTILNYFGVKNSARILVLLTLLKIGILALFVIVGIFFINPSNYVPFAPTGVNGIFVASAFVFFAYTGFGRVTAFGEEVKKPKSTIPKAILYSIMISCVIYLLVMLVFVGIEPYTLSDGSASPLEGAILYAIHNVYIGYAIAVGALIATVNVALSQMLGTSRVVFAMARDKDFPKFLSKLNRFGTPSMSLFISMIVMIITIYVIDFKNIISLTNASALVIYAVANLAGLKLYLKRRNNPRGMLFKSRYFVLVPLMGLFTTTLLLFFLTVLSLWLTLLLVLAITVYYLVDKFLNRRKR